jgi:hypothetical protein
MDTILPFDRPYYTASNFFACYLIQQAIDTQQSFRNIQDKALKFPKSSEAMLLLAEAKTEEEHANVVLQETANRWEEYFGVSA